MAVLSSKALGAELCKIFDITMVNIDKVSLVCEGGNVALLHIERAITIGEMEEVTDLLLKMKQLTREMPEEPSEAVKAAMQAMHDQYAAENGKALGPFINHAVRIYKVIRETLQQPAKFNPATLPQGEFRHSVGKFGHFNTCICEDCEETRYEVTKEISKNSTL